MSTVVTARIARADSGAFRYQRHQPEKTLLYQLVLKHYPEFRQQLAEEGRVLPDYVQREFEDYLKCGRLFEKDSSHWSSHIDSAIWSLRRLYALWVPGALNLNPNAARFTFTCCSWMECMLTATMDRFDFAGSVPQPLES
jgi:hypothetical protein